MRKVTLLENDQTKIEGNISEAGLRMMESFEDDGIYVHNDGRRTIIDCSSCDDIFKCLDAMDEAMRWIT